MRKENILMVSAIVVIFCLSGDLFAKKTELLKKDKVIQGVKCAKGHEVVYHRDGTLGLCTMAEGRDVHGIDFPKGTNFGYWSGGSKRIQIILYVDQIINKIRFTKDTILDYREDGTLDTATPPEDHEIQGIICAGKKGAIFYRNGQLGRATLAYDQTIQGVKCASSWLTTRFHENGKLSVCKLAEDKRIKKINLPRGTLVSFDDRGNFGGAKFETDQKIQGVKCSKFEYVLFHENGKLKKAILAENHKIQGIGFKKGMVVYFDKDGMPQKTN